MRGAQKRSRRENSVGAELVRRLQKFVEVLESDEPLEKHFTIRRVAVPVAPHRNQAVDVFGRDLGQRREAPPAGGALGHRPVGDGGGRGGAGILASGEGRQRHRTDAGGEQGVAGSFGRRSGSESYLTDLVGQL